MQIGYVGFREGKFNPDLMMMLMEPLMYLLMALAEKAGVEYRIDDEDDDEDDSLFEEKAKNISETVKQSINTGKVPSGVLPTNIVEQIENLEIPQQSLLSKSEEVQPEMQQSLLDRGENK
jgi:hypothetical protein